MKLTYRAALAALAGLAIGASAQAATVDLVTNGDFEAGNTGFTTDLLYTPAELVSTAGAYAIDTDPQPLNSFFTSFGDHTTGTGNMMIVNGTTTNGTLAWQQTVSVVAGTTYNFSIWLANAFNGGGTALDLVVDGSSVATAGTTPGVSGEWNQFGGDWMASSTGTVALQIIENSTGFSGNDYALDDITFKTDNGAGGGGGGGTPSPVPLPASVWLLGLGVAGVFGMRRKPAA